MKSIMQYIIDVIVKTADFPQQILILSDGFQVHENSRTNNENPFYT